MTSLITRQADLMRAGLSSTQVAEKLGIPKGTVIDRSNRHPDLKGIRWTGSSYKPNLPKHDMEKIARLGGPKTDEARAYDCSSMRLPLHELEHNQCRWIVEGEGADALYCGHKRRAKSILSFCGHHVTRATR